MHVFVFCQRFPKVLHRFFVIQDLIFEDRSGVYVLEGSWFLLKGDKGVFRAANTDPDSWQTEPLPGRPPGSSPGPPMTDGLGHNKTL